MAVTTTLPAPAAATRAKRRPAPRAGSSPLYVQQTLLDMDAWTRELLNTGLAVKAPRAGTR